jgi:pentatricopeptide repeat protein
MLENDNTLPNNFSFNTAIDTACKCGDLEYALELFNMMKEHNYKHDLITYGSLVKGYIKAKQYTNLCDIITKLRDENIRIDEMFLKSIFNRSSLHCGSYPIQVQCLTPFIS